MRPWAALMACASLVLVAHVSSAEPRRVHDATGALLPDFAKMQMGGYVGLIAPGLGYSFFADHLNTTLFYGFTPAFVGGTNIHVIAWNLSWRPAVVPLAEVWDWTPVYVGAGLLYAFGDGLFIRTPKRYPGGYYRPTGLRGLFHLGTEVRLFANEQRFPQAHALFAEVTALDHSAYVWLKNEHGASLLDVLSSSIGYELTF